jgi:hypothetical protein
MRRIILVVSVLSCDVLQMGTSMAQTSQQGLVYVSAHAGGFVSSLEGFENIYDSRLGFAFGGGFGLPLLNHLYLHCDATYFSRTGSNILTALPTWTRPGPVNYRQWLVDGGLQYDFILSDRYSLNLLGGITFTSVSEDIHTYDLLSSPVGVDEIMPERGKVFGYFAGLSVERSFESSPFAIFADAQYNFTRMTMFYWTGNYGGVNVHAGVRYYFEL